MLINVPIESLKERYSAQWNKWIPNELKRLGVPFTTIYSGPLSDKINTGSFLDVVCTNHFKASQLQQICQMIHEGEIKDGDVFFFHDLWFPGLEMLAYIRDGLGLDISICGILHAGTYDPHDFLSKRNMNAWGRRLEESWFQLVDKIFVTTEFHKQLIMSCRDVDNSKIKIAGYPLEFKDFVDPKIEKENIVVFPHRLDEEKNPQLFDLLAERCKASGWQFIKTKEYCQSKEEYYNLLNRSKIAVSFADQETFGIAQAEALFCGCIPIVPDRLSYQELYQDRFKFDSFEHAVDKVMSLISSPQYFNEHLSLLNQNSQLLKGKVEQAIPIMVKEMGF